jgi:tRNA-dihydrouridine synthase
VREYGCIAGINVTASHNPKEYNGYKVYWEDGAQLPPVHADEVAKKMKELTGCDYLLVGRGAMGNPFVFSEINAGFSGEEIPVFSLEEKLDVLRRQVKLMVEYKGERTAMLESRKHASWYIKGMRGAAAMRRMCGEITAMDDIERIIEKALEVSEKM